MNKNEQLAILDSVFQQMKSMSEEQLFDYMKQNSQTFNNMISEIQNRIDVSQKNIRFDIDSSKPFISAGDIWTTEYQTVA